MPPRKAANGSSSSQRGGERLVAASPARSTRSARSQHGEDGENDSNQASVKAPPSKTSRNGGLNLKDTSVNIAAAFNAAQGGYLPTPHTSSHHRPPSGGESSGSKRALSPAEQLADSARALSPVRFFLHPTDHSESVDFGSFSSLADQTGNSVSYDYQREEEYVRAKMKGEGHSRKGSEARRRKKAIDGDMPYRPAEDDWVNGSDASDADGEGIVKGGALEGRAATRGKTREKGEGYLGTGLGIQPRRRLNRNGHDASDEEQVDEAEYDRFSPAPSYHGRVGFSRSPTPAQLLRALTPRASPGPRPVAARRRQPSSLRTMVTNILHGIVVALRMTTELFVAVLRRVVLSPLELLTGSSKTVLRQIRQNWWKGLGAIIAFSLLVRLLNRSTDGHQHRGIGTSALEASLNDRLSSLEKALATLAGAEPSLPNSREEPIDRSDLLDRIARIETAVATNSGDAKTRKVDALADELARVRSEVSGMSSKIDLQGKAVEAVQVRASMARDLERDLRAVEKRVDKVEDQVRAALDDGRLRQAVERILPEWMPIKRRKGGLIDVEPVFWTEMRKVLVGKDDLDKAIQASVAGHKAGGMSERDMQKWGDRLFEQKAAQGLVITRDQFLQAMNNELEDLKYRMDQSRQQVTSTAKPSTVVYKTHKGDDITSMLQELVDAAILKYSKDTLAKPDYALFTAGARVIPSITSDTLLLKAAPRLGKWFAGMQDVVGRSPATALHPDNSVGSCWPIKGDKGQLGVLLSRRAVVTDITIEHAAKDLSPDVRTAPKAIEVWGLVEGEASKAKVAEYLESRTHDRSTATAPSSDHLLLATLQYDPHAADPTQTFPIPPAVTELGIDMGIVVFKIESNWGGDLTCLYRVRVHGHELGDEIAD